MTKIVSFKLDEVTYTLLKDKRFTLCMGIYGDEKRSYHMFGMAFCSMLDAYNEYMGCLKAIKRMCNNLKLTREQRLPIFFQFATAYESRNG